jgi:outer membrane protein
MNRRRTLWLRPLVVAFAAASALAQPPQRLTLEQAQAIAVQNHPRIRAAQFSAQAASQAPRELRSVYYPTAFGSLTGAGAEHDSRLTAGGLNNPIIYNRYASGFSVGQFITDFGRTRNLVASSNLQAQAAQENTRTTREQILLQVDQAYFDALRAQAVLRVAQQTVDARQLVADQVTALAKSKLKSDLDVSFANVNLAEAKLLLVQAQNDVQASIARLSEAIGYRDRRAIEVADAPMPPPPPAHASGLVSDALRQRPELISERLNLQASQKFARAERDLWFPTISLVAGAGVTPFGQAALASSYSAAGLNVNIPVFNGHLFSARRAEAELKTQAEDQNVRDLEDRIARDVRLAWLNAKTAYQRLGLTQQLLDEANLALDLAQARYKLGLGTIVELSQAQLNQTEAEIQQTSAKYDYQLQAAILNYQVGVNP